MLWVVKYQLLFSEIYQKFYKIYRFPSHGTCFFKTAELRCYTPTQKSACSSNWILSPMFGIKKIFKIPPTYPWNIPRTLHQQFWRNFFHCGVLGKSGVSPPRVYGQNHRSLKQPHYTVVYLQVRSRGIPVRYSRYIYLHVPKKNLPNE